MKNFIWSLTLLTVMSILGMAPIGGSAAVAQSDEKIPREVIDAASADGSVLVLVGLKVPWQMESRLSDEEVRAQRDAIASIQSDLLTELEGRQFKVLRRYQEVPGIAMEVGADVLAELARSEKVTNVLLDRPAKVSVPATSEKVPSQLFRRAASDGTVLVLCGLRAPWQREDQLNDELLTLQRNSILAAQRYVLNELNGTQFRVVRLYQRIPGIALRVGLDALRVLEKSPAVTNVVQDRPARSSP